MKKSYEKPSVTKRAVVQHITAGTRNGALTMSMVPVDKSYVTMTNG